VVVSSQSILGAVPDAPEVLLQSREADCYPLLPEGWESRLIKVQNANTDLKIGYCLEPHDLAASKLAAGRDKDWPFVEAMLRRKIVDGRVVKDRIMLLPIPGKHKQRLRDWVRAHGAQ